MKVYYIIPLNDLLTGHPENFQFKLYTSHYFLEKLSLLYNIILELPSMFHVYIYKLKAQPCKLKKH